MKKRMLAFMLSIIMVVNSGVVNGTNIVYAAEISEDEANSVVVSGEETISSVENEKNGNSVVSISVETMPVTKYVNNSYFVGTNGEVKVLYADGSSEIIVMRDGAETSNGEKLIINNNWMDQLGEYEIILQCGDAYTSLVVERCLAEVYGDWDGESPLNLEREYEYNVYVYTFTPKITGLYEMTVNDEVNWYCNWWFDVYNEKDGIKLDTNGIDTVDRVTTLVAGHTYYLYVCIWDPDGRRTFQNPVKASCVCIEPATYTVSYNANGGDIAPTAQTKIAGEDLILSLSIPSKFYTITYNANGGSVESQVSNLDVAFKCWNTKDNGAGASYNAGSIYSSDSDVTLYAQYDNIVKLGSLSTPTRDGYTFKGWYTEAEGGTKVTENTVVTGDMTIYAHWTKDEPVYTDDVEAFVARLYVECLNRQPDEAGLKDWVQRLKSKEITGISAAYGFIFSPEFLKKNLCNEDFVEQLYEAFMGRASDAAGKADWVSKLESGVTREEVFNGFALSNEFRKLCKKYEIELGTGVDMPAEGTIPTGPCKVCGKETVVNQDPVEAFVQRLYRICLNRTADAEGLETWTIALKNKTKSGRDVAYGFIFSPEFKEKNTSNDEYVEYLYKAFMGRGSDPSGKEDWMNRMAKGWTREQVFDGFVGSDEFTEICNTYGIIRD